MNDWWKTFFDADYYRIWGGFTTPERTRAEAKGLWTLLGLTDRSRVLDAPCGYGRLSRALAELGATVLGVDYSTELLTRAEEDRDGIEAPHLRYLQADLRRPLEEGGFDAAINVYSSLGYGTEDDDVAILKTLKAAVRPGGLVLLETNHRDSTVIVISRGIRNALRLADGTLVVEEPKFDPIHARVETTWHWSGPGGSGSKPASFRSYSATELVQLIERAGLTFRSAHRGCSPDPFKGDASDIGGRLGLLAERSA